MKQLHNLITNTTSLVGYIAVLMFVGAYLGGDSRDAMNRISTFDPTLLKGSVMESRDAINRVSTKSVIVTIDGREYEAVLEQKTAKKPEFTY